MAENGRSGPVRGPRLVTLVLLSALAILPVNIFLPSLAHMASGFAVEYGNVSYSLSADAATSALFQIMVGPFSDRFGSRPVILVSMAVFVLATLGCALATDFRTFLACRMAQALIAPTYAVALASIRDASDPQAAASGIGYLAMAWALAPMLGPSLGGWLNETFGWRASFWFLGLFGLAVWVLCWVDLSETNTDPSRSISGQFRAYPLLLRSSRFWACSLCMAWLAGVTLSEANARYGILLVMLVSSRAALIAALAALHLERQPERG